MSGFLDHPLCVHSFFGSYNDVHSSIAHGELCNDLGSLVVYHLLEYTLEDMAEEEEDKEQEQRRMCKAIDVIRRWGTQGEWREGEEWFEDVLVGLATGRARATCLPTPEELSTASQT